MFVPAILIALLAIPLALSLVPPNRVYGFRTAQTLSNRELWFRVNRVAGLALIAASAAALAIYRYRPELATGSVGVLVLILPTLAALMGTGWYARRVVRREAPGGGR